MRRVGVLNPLAENDPEHANIAAWAPDRKLGGIQCSSLSPSLLHGSKGRADVIYFGKEKAAAKGCS
jgi:hypothetical protein